MSFDVSYIQREVYHVIGILKDVGGLSVAFSFMFSILVACLTYNSERYEFATYLYSKKEL